MNEQNSNPEHAAALTKEVEENHVQVIQEIREWKAKKNKVKILIRETRKELRTIKKNKKHARRYLKQLKRDLACINDDIGLASELGPFVDEPVMQCANLTPTVPDDCAHQEEPTGYPHLRLERCNVDDSDKSMNPQSVTSASKQEYGIEV
ncbi:hypothetical protein SIID45300_01053 [Candidatus Magnetaquicoccaceae bacterium FCR-1]|uniref:Uncharacterized protein n=1 Tax=Candidatus Magnetaquiglobus chichijimensis TaxID=3141448 RepID=A0ABQ0C783_9PROT